MAKSFLEKWFEEHPIEEEVIEVVQTLSLKDFILLEAIKRQWPDSRSQAAILLNELETK